jgi:hypothetical protein
MVEEGKKKLPKSSLYGLPALYILSTFYPALPFLSNLDPKIYGSEELSYVIPILSFASVFRPFIPSKLGKGDTDFYQILMLN